MIKKINEVIKDFESYLYNKIDNQSDFDMYYTEGYNYSYIVDHLDLHKDDYICFLDDFGKIVNFAYYENKEGLDIISLDSASKQILKENIDDIKNYYKRPLVSFTEMYDYDNLDIIPIEKKSKIIGKDYRFRDNYYCLKEADKNVLVDKADEFNFPPMSDKLTFDILNYNEFTYEKMRNDKIISTSIDDDSGHTHIAGFHYMGLYDGSDDRVLVAKSGDNVVGAIKFGEYGNNKYTPKHIGLCFVDVSAPYRGQGIATKLLEEFGKVIESENGSRKEKLPIYLTEESEMGKKCHMKDIAIEQIKNVVVYCENKDFLSNSYVMFYNGEQIGDNFKSIEDFNKSKNSVFEIN